MHGTRQQQHQVQHLQSVVPFGEWQRAVLDSIQQRWVIMLVAVSVSQTLLLCDQSIECLGDITSGISTILFVSLLPRLLSGYPGNDEDMCSCMCACLCVPVVTTSTTAGDLLIVAYSYCRFLTSDARCDFLWMLVVLPFIRPLLAEMRPAPVLIMLIMGSGCCHPCVWGLDA